MRRIISTDQAPAAIGTYSQAVQAGNTVYISGQIPLDPVTGAMVEGDFEAQARQVFSNLSAVAEAAGKEPPRVVVHRSGPGAEVSIENPGRLAADFDFDARSGIGTGLGLVRALMPVPGMSVSYRQKGDLVRVEVHIAPPVLSEAPLATEGILP